MANIEIWFEQDLMKPVRVQNLGNIFNQDSLGNLIGVRVKKNGDDFTLSGSVNGYCIIADGSTVPVIGTRSGNEASIILPASAYSVNGPIAIAIKLTDGNAITTLAACVGIVTRSRTGVQINPGQTVTDWTNQIAAALQDVEDAASNVAEAIATPYTSLTFPVARGTYCSHNGNMYIAKVDIPTSEEWTASHWTITNSGKEIFSNVSDLKSAINDLNTDGENVYHILPDGTESKKVKFADGCIVDGFFVKAPNITAYNKCQWDGNVGDRNGGCLCVFDIVPDHTYKIFRSNATDFSFSGGYSTHLLIDGEYYGYSNAINTQNTVKTFSLNATQKTAGVNQLRLVLVMAEVDDSYVYDDNTGEICFAGKNTQYYGKKYIDGHLSDSNAVLLSNKNLDTVKLGLAVGKDGLAHQSIDSDTVNTSGIKFAKGVIDDAFYATYPSIYQYNKALYDDVIVDKPGACITDLIPINALHTYTIYRANANGFSFGGATQTHIFADDTYIGRSNTINTDNAPKVFTVGQNLINNGANHIRLILITAEIDDSYMYDNVTGEVSFAGKNTQYYGKRHINGAYDTATVLSTENLDDVDIGMVIGKDGAIHPAINDLAIQGKGIKLANSAIEEATYETKPRIAEYGVKGTDDAGRSVNALTCITGLYKLTNDKRQLRYYQAKPNDVDISWSGDNTIKWYNNGEYVGYNTITGAYNQENSMTVLSNTDAFTFPLIIPSIDDSYVYESDTGYIYFAGKNTPYYGLRTIYDATGSGTLAATIKEIDDDIMILRNGNHDMIPLFLTTDQHNTSIDRVVNAFLKNANMKDISKIMNLGDTVGDHWIIDDEDNPYIYTHQLDDYAKQVRNIPDEKRLDVFGNHDTWGVTPLTTPQNRLYKYFYNKYARYFDNHGNFTMVDDYYNVKYLVVGGYEYTGPDTAYTTYEISSKALDWIIGEMEKDDGYDIIILSHQPLAANGVQYHNPVKNTDYGVESIADYDYSSIWAARKNKTSGTITDAYGVTHTYDFTGCNSELLCGLHGHEHKDGIGYVGGVLCDVIFQCYSKQYDENVCYYLLVDRQNRQVNIWRIDTLANTYTNYQLPFDPS